MVNFNVIFSFVTITVLLRHISLVIQVIHWSILAYFSLIVTEPHRLFKSQIGKKEKKIWVPTTNA